MIALAKTAMASVAGGWMFVSLACPLPSKSPMTEQALLPSSGQPPADRSLLPMGCEAGCQLSQQTVGVTAIVVTATWGAGSTPGTCVPYPPPNQSYCHSTMGCEFGAYQVTVTGTGTLQWRDPSTGQFGKKLHLGNPDGGPGKLSTQYGDAANPTPKECGGGTIDVYFPDDLAGGGALCTSCT